MTNLRESLTKYSITQEQFAMDLGVTVSTVSRWIRGHTKPSRLAQRAITAQLELYKIQKEENTYHETETEP